MWLQFCHWSARCHTEAGADRLLHTEHTCYGQATHTPAERSTLGRNGQRRAAVCGVSVKLAKPNLMRFYQPAAPSHTTDKFAPTAGCECTTHHRKQPPQLLVATTQAHATANRPETRETGQQTAYERYNNEATVCQHHTPLGRGQEERAGRSEGGGAAATGNERSLGQHVATGAICNVQPAQPGHYTGVNQQLQPPPWHFETANGQESTSHQDDGAARERWSRESFRQERAQRRRYAVRRRSGAGEGMEESASHHHHHHHQSMHVRGRGEASPIPALLRCSCCSSSSSRRQCGRQEVAEAGKPPIIRPGCRSRTSLWRLFAQEGKRGEDEAVAQSIGHWRMRKRPANT